MILDSKAISFGVFLGDVVMKLKMKRSKQLCICGVFHKVVIPDQTAIILERAIDARSLEGGF